MVSRMGTFLCLLYLYGYKMSTPVVALLLSTTVRCATAKTRKDDAEVSNTDEPSCEFIYAIRGLLMGKGKPAEAVAERTSA